jgi:Protein of unknown function (DUF1566)
MNHFYKTLKRLALVCASVLALGGGALHAEPFYASKDGSMVLDKATNLVWQRCSVGQQWNGNDCAGKASSFTMVQAKRIAPEGWRLPTKDELLTLLWCSYPTKSSASCNTASEKPRIDTLVFPDARDYVWTSTINDKVSDWAWMVMFIEGDLRENNFINTSGGFARFVRTSELLGYLSDSNFPQKLKTRKEELAAQQEVTRIAESKHQEDARREQAAHEVAAVAAWRKLVASGPQNMYLQAGSEQNAGDSSKARRIYEAIIDKYSSSPFAVKASDQLTSMSRSNRETEAQRDADRNSSNRAACFSQVNSCVANCRASSMSSNGISACVSNCQRSCN